MSRLLIDTNIVIDLLSKRKKFYNEAADLFSRADKKELELTNFNIDICQHELYSYKTKIRKRGERNIKKI